MKKITIVGLGYVGLPLAVEFGKNIQLLVMILILKELRKLTKVLIKLWKSKKQN